MNKPVMDLIRKLLHGLLVLWVPVMLSAVIIRLLLTPAFVQIEYNLPGFPPDRYGFSKGERIRYAQQARRYLVTDQGLEALEELTFEDGKPLFNDRELSHLRDVKLVIRGLYRAAWAGLLAGAAAGYWSYRKREWSGLITSMSSGGWLTVGVVLLIVVLSLLSFQSFFFKFHRVFFEGDTWLFKNSDTLIRLFPLRFWRDAFLLFGVLSLVGGAALAGFPFWLRSRRSG